jgi:hypothetical protein
MSKKLLWDPLIIKKGSGAVESFFGWYRKKAYFVSTEASPLGAGNLVTVQFNKYLTAVKWVRVKSAKGGSQTISVDLVFEESANQSMDIRPGFIPVLVK